MSFNQIYLRMFLIIKLLRERNSPPWSHVIHTTSNMFTSWSWCADLISVFVLVSEPVDVTSASPDETYLFIHAWLSFSAVATLTGFFIGNFPSFMDLFNADRTRLVTSLVFSVTPNISSWYRPELFNLSIISCASCWDMAAYSCSSVWSVLQTSSAIFTSPHT